MHFPFTYREVYDISNVKTTDSVSIFQFNYILFKKFLIERTKK